MKGFHKNSRRIENEVFILYMLNHELVIAPNLQKNPNCFKISLLRMENLQNPHNRNRTKTYSFQGILNKLCFFVCPFLFVCFERSINQFRFFFYSFPVGDVWINENVQKLYLLPPFYESLPFCVWQRHSL